jgi:hypothetical protein
MNEAEMATPILDILSDVLSDIDRPARSSCVMTARKIAPRIAKTE